MLIKKILIVVLLTAICFGSSGIILYKWYFQFDIIQMLWVALPPTLVLGAAALLVSIKTLNMFSAIMTIMSYWAFEMITRATITKNVSLFLGTYPITGIDFNENRIILLLIGLVSFFFILS